MSYVVQADSKLIQSSVKINFNVNDLFIIVNCRETDYSIENIDNQLVLNAGSASFVSGLIKVVSINLRGYPYVNWRWRTNQKLPERNEQQKPGDEYVPEYL